MRTILISSKTASFGLCMQNADGGWGDTDKSHNILDHDVMRSRLSLGRVSRILRSRPGDPLP